MTDNGDERCIRVVVTGDNHLAQRLSRLPVERALARRQIVRDSFAATVQAAITRGADLFVQAGDLFDVPDPSNQDREFVAQQALRLQAAGILLCAVSGNHDMPRQSLDQGGAAPLGIYATLGALHYFPDTRVIRPILLERHGLKLAIGGLSNDPGRRAGEDPLAQIDVVDPEHKLVQADVGLLIVHAALGGGTAMLGDAECVIQPESLAMLRGFQVVVTGHIHKYQRRKVGGLETVVCGPSEWMDFGDAQSGEPGYAWLEIGPQGLARDEHALLPAQPRRTITMRTADIFPANAKLEDATNRIIERITPLCGPEVMVRLWLDGIVTREQYRALDIRRIFAWGQAHCFAFEINERGLTWQPDLVAGATGVVRGERVAPREVLAQVVSDQLNAAPTPAEHALWDAVRADLLQRFDALGNED